MAANGSTRPTRLRRGFLIFFGIVFAVELATGIGLWRVHELREDGIEPPQWNGMVRALHGALTPVLAAQFGYLCALHIPGGWRMKANRLSGALMVLGFVLLFVTAIGLYYSNAQHLHASIHITTGFLLPFVLGWHIIAGQKWAK
ncbi:MAG TPA: hypothetical protein VEH27_03585 [Methylomirabilota bacterium]|nr:hypothetical protein [Methylomirabilota bacterium]